MRNARGRTCATCEGARIVESGRAPMHGMLERGKKSGQLRDMIDFERALPALPMLPAISQACGMHYALRVQ